MTYCCTVMQRHAEYRCPQHGADCPDRVVNQLASGDFVLPIRDGGSSGIAITHCPWCGTGLAVQSTESQDSFKEDLKETFLSDHFSDRTIGFGRILMQGEDLIPEGSWLLTEDHGGTVSSFIALSTTEAHILGQTMVRKTSLYATTHSGIPEEPT